MAMHGFEPALAHVLAQEGGFVDHPLDPGGATKMGITRATLARFRGRPVSVAEVMALTRAEAAAIPLPSGAADLVFVSMAYHHFEDKPAAAREIRRVLAPGGLVALRNTTVDALARIETMILANGGEMPLKALRKQMSQAIDLVIQLKRDKNGHLRRH